MMCGGVLLGDAWIACVRVGVLAGKIEDDMQGGANEEGYLKGRLDANGPG